MLYLIILFVLLQVLDAITTWKCLQLKGRYEANPVMSKLMSKIGVVKALVLAKSLVIALVTVLAYKGYINLSAMSAICMLYIAVVINNAKQAE